MSGRPDAPRGAAAVRVLAQASFEARAVLRNGEQLLVTLVLPVALLVGLVRTSVLDLPGDAGQVDVATPGALALGVMSAGFTSQAIATAFDRRYGVLRLLATTPLGREGLLAGKLVAVLLVVALQVLLVGVAGLVLGWRPDLGGILPALVLLLLGSAAFTGLGLVLAGLLRPEAVLALANIVWVVLLVAGGVLVPAEVLPGAGPAIAAWLPSGALGDGLRTALVDGGVPLREALVLVGWTLAAALAVRRWFRWA